MKTKEFIAFTLAEVLIVIGIIGIVAQMTIPTLVNNVQDAQYKTMYKKAFSTLNQALITIASDNGGSLKNLCADSDNTCVRDAFANKMNWTKKCENANITGNCWANSWTRLNGNATWAINYYGNEAAMNLSDGTFLVFVIYKPNCDYIENPGVSTLMSCAYAQIDINGLNKPNKIGKDIFLVHLQENAIKPFGTSGDWVSIGYAANGLANYYMCDPKGDGEICAYDFLFK